jgi:hypothetical protein
MPVENSGHFRETEPADFAFDKAYFRRGVLVPAAKIHFVISAYRSYLVRGRRQAETFVKEICEFRVASSRASIFKELKLFGCILVHD